MGCGLAVHAEVRAAAEAAAKALEGAGCAVEPMASFLTPEMLDGTSRFFEARSHSDYMQLPAARRAKVLPFIAEWCTWRAERFSGREVMQGYGQVMAMREAAVSASRRFDFVISPTSPILPYAAELPSPTNDPRNALPHIAFTVPYNMSEQPAASLNWRCERRWPADRRAGRRPALRRRGRARSLPPARAAAPAAACLSAMSAALRFGGELIAPAELERRAARAAAGLERSGVGEGDVVALMLHNEPGVPRGDARLPAPGRLLLPDQLALQGGRGRPHPARQRRQGSGHRGSAPGADSTWRPRCRFDHRRLGNLARAASALEGSARTPRGNMPYTSGTTGRPKGVRRAPADEEQRRLAAELYRVALGVEPGMRAMVSAPLYHSAPNLYATQALLGGALLALEPRFDAEATLAAIERHRLTNLYLVPTMYVRLLRLPPETRRAL